MQISLSAQLDELALYTQLKQLVRAHSSRRDHVVVSALVELTKLPKLSKTALMRHGRRLSAWLNELSRLGDIAHADALVASIAVVEALTGRPQPPVTLEALVLERLAHHCALLPAPEERITAIAHDVFQGCPSRERCHWDRVIALATDAVG